MMACRFRVLCIVVAVCACGLVGLGFYALLLLSGHDGSWVCGISGLCQIFEETTPGGCN
jgi:hypothetical protein